MPTQLDITNQALAFLGRLPVANPTNDQSAQLLFAQVANNLTILCKRTDWNNLMVFYTDNTPLTNNFSTDYVYSFQLPFNYARLDRFSQNLVYNNTWRILDGLLLTNNNPIQYYYVINNPDYSVLTDLFSRTLALFAASDLCLQLTNDIQLAAKLQKDYMDSLNDAIMQNDMESQKINLPGNSFNRIQYV